MVWIADIIFGSVLNEITQAAFISVLVVFIGYQVYLDFKNNGGRNRKKERTETKLTRKNYVDMWFGSPNFLVLVAISLLCYVVFHAAWAFSSIEFALCGTSFALFGLFYLILVDKTRFLAMQIEELKTKNSREKP